MHVRIHVVRMCHLNSKHELISHILRVMQNLAQLILDTKFLKVLFHTPLDYISMVRQ